jgi:CRP-like cAMP-binding protein
MDRGMKKNLNIFIEASSRSKDLTGGFFFDLLQGVLEFTLMLVAPGDRRNQRWGSAPRYPKPQGLSWNGRVHLIRALGLDDASPFGGSIMQIHQNHEELFDFFEKVKHIFNTLGFVHKYPCNVEIYQQGMACKAIYLIEQGSVKLTFIDPQGYEVIVAVRQPYWLLGIASAILGKPHSVTAVTLGKCTLRAIPGKQFLELAESSREITRFIMSLLSQEIQSHIKKVSLLSCLSAEERLQYFLTEIISLENPGKLGEQVEIGIQLKHTELAQLVAVSPEHLSRLLKKMEKKGTLSRNHGALILKNPSALFREALIWKIQKF